MLFSLSATARLSFSFSPLSFFIFLWSLQMCNTAKGSWEKKNPKWKKNGDRHWGTRLPQKSVSCENPLHRLPLFLCSCLYVCVARSPPRKEGMEGGESAAHFLPRGVVTFFFLTFNFWGGFYTLCGHILPSFVLIFFTHFSTTFQSRIHKKGGEETGSGCW